MEHQQISKLRPTLDIFDWSLSYAVLDVKQLTTCTPVPVNESLLVYLNFFFLILNQCFYFFLSCQVF